MPFDLVPVHLHFALSACHSGNALPNRHTHLAKLDMCICQWFRNSCYVTVLSDKVGVQASMEFYDMVRVMSDGVKRVFEKCRKDGQNESGRCLEPTS